MADESELRVEFCGEEYSAAPGDRLSFGRSADIVIDDNRYLHRVLGEFGFADGLWWLRNTGSSIAIDLIDDTSPSYARVSPGRSVPVSFESASLRFEAGGTSYEMTLDLVGDFGPDETLDEPPIDDLDPSEMTTTTSSLPLTPEQFELLVALAAPLLRNEEQVRTNRQIAAALGWTVTKYNRKLDGLCVKFAKAGVTGLHGSSDRLAKDRRLRLAEHVIHAGIVRFDHLPDT